MGEEAVCGLSERLRLSARLEVLYRAAGVAGCCDNIQKSDTPKLVAVINLQDELMGVKLLNPRP